MLINMLFGVIVSCGLILIGSNAEKHASNVFKQQIDNLKKDLLQQNWTEQEERCRSTTLNILNNLLNQTLWASRIWDSIQIPSGILYGSKFQLGNFDECLDMPWAESHPALRTQYCLLELQFSDRPPVVLAPDPYTHLSTYLNSLKEVRFHKLSWGVCVPAKCQAESIEKIVRSLLKNSYLGFLEPQTNVTVELCQHWKPFNTDNALLLTCSAIFLITSVSIISFYYNLHKNRDFKGRSILKCFSLTDNLAKLLPHTADQYRTLHGLRFIIAVVVIYGHGLHFRCLVGFSNALYIDKLLQNYKLYWIMHLDNVVDALFTISGFLLMKNFLSMPKVFHPLSVIMIRYIRFAPSLLLFLVITKLLMHDVIEGPMLSKVQDEMRACDDNWWINIFMLGNYVNTTNMCYPGTWSIPVDFHMTIFCTLLFWLYGKHSATAKLLYLLALVASVVWPAFETYRLQLPPVLNLTVESIRYYRSHLLQMPTYLCSHLRAGPYLIGFAFAYFTSYYKPQQRMKITSKITSVILLIVSVSIFFAIMYCGGSYFISGDYGPIEAALFAGSNRALSALCVCGIIMACEYSTLPVVPAFLSCTVFTIVSKLSYQIYLIHSPIILRKLMTTRNPIQFEMTLWLFDGLEVCVISLMLGFVAWLFFEKPINNLLSAYIKYMLNNSNSKDVDSNDAIQEEQESRHPNGLTQDKDKSL